MLSTCWPSPTSIPRHYQGIFRPRDKLFFVRQSYRGRVSYLLLRCRLLDEVFALNTRGRERVREGALFFALLPHNHRLFNFLIPPSKGRSAHEFRRTRMTKCTMKLSHAIYHSLSKHNRPLLRFVHPLIIDLLLQKVRRRLAFRANRRRSFTSTTRRR